MAAETSIGMINYGTAVVGDVAGRTAAKRSPGRRTVLVVTALPEEFQAARDAATGVGEWRLKGERGSAPYLSGEYVTGDGRRIPVALARATRMGGRSIAPFATTLAHRLRPVCIAIPGVCAGDPERTAPGDVVIADRVYEYDEGKADATAFQGDHQQYPLDNRWLRAAQDFRPEGLPSYGGGRRFSVHVGPMASGSAVVEDPRIWSRLRAMGVRTITALDMEAATIATVAHDHRIPHWLAVKGVMDHAESGRDDHHKAFAARASAEVLWALLASLVRPEPADDRVVRLP